MSVDYNSELMFAYEFKKHDKIELYTNRVEEVKKCFEHDIPYDPDKNFDPKTGEELYHVYEEESEIDGYDEDTMKFRGLYIHQDPYSGNNGYIGHVLPSFISTNDILNYDFVGATNDIKNALEELGVTFDESRVGLHSFEYYS